MPAPDLKNPEALAAYRREIRAYMRPVRWLALSIMFIGLLLMLWPIYGGGPWYIGSFKTLNVAWSIIALGWAVASVVIVRRVRYHRRRMRGED